MLIPEVIPLYVREVAIPKIVRGKIFQRDVDVRFPVNVGPPPRVPCDPRQRHVRARLQDISQWSQPFPMSQVDRFTYGME